MISVLILFSFKILFFLRNLFSQHEAQTHTNQASQAPLLCSFLIEKLGVGILNFRL